MSLYEVLADGLKETAMIRVLIVSHTRMVADLIAAALQKERDIAVAGVAADEHEALRHRSCFDIAIVDAALPGTGAERLIDALDCARRGPHVVVFRVCDSHAAVSYMALGAAGCVGADEGFDQILEAIRLVAGQGIALPPAFVAPLMARVAELAERCRRLGSRHDRSFNQRILTRREREILDLISRGYGNREIAKHLTIELGTAKNHVHSILGKLEVSSRKEAATCWSLAANQL